MGIRFCQHDCEYLKPTEEEQKYRRKENHICQKYGKRVIHFEYHPELIMLDKCDEQEDENLIKKYSNPSETRLQA